MTFVRIFLLLLLPILSQVALAKQTTILVMGDSLSAGYGIKVEEVFAGKMRSVGIREGFIITKINHTPVKSVKTFTDLLSSTKGGVLIEGFYENGKREFYGFGV